MGRKKIVSGEFIVGLDEETIRLVERFSREEMLPIGTYLRKVIRTHVLAEANRRGWLKEEAPLILTS
jgi:hypothetical protein